MAVTRTADSGNTASLCRFECVAVFYRSFLFLFLAYVLGVALNSQLGEFRERISFLPKAFYINKSLLLVLFGHYWKEPCSVPFAPFLKVFIDADEIPPSHLFSRLQSCNFLSLSSKGRCSSPVITFTALHWTLSGMSMSLLYWEAENWKLPQVQQYW